MPLFSHFPTQPAGAPSGWLGSRSGDRPRLPARRAGRRIGALILPLVTPGKPVLSYLAATAAAVVILLASMIAHEPGHAVALRRYRGSAEATVGFFGGVGHGRADLPSARAQWQIAWPGPWSACCWPASAWPP